MQRVDASVGPAPAGESPDSSGAAVRLRLYVARSTPNSVRAEGNLLASMAELGHGPSRFELEIVDVFAQPGRAITDGIIVTPTLLGLRHGRRVVLIGDLADKGHLQGILRSLMHPE